MKFSTRLLSVILVCVLIALLVPMFAIGREAAPQLDDFWNASAANDARLAGGGVKDVAAAAVSHANDIYMNWQGTWGAVLLMTLQPFVWNMEYYALSLWFVLLSLLLCVFCLVWTLGKHVLKLDVPERFCLYALVMIPCTQLLPSPLEAFYYYVGGVFYTFYFSLSALLFGLITAFWFRRKGKGANAAYYILIPLLSVFTAGGNYTTGLITVLALLAAAIYDLFIRKSRNALVSISFLLFLAAFCLSLFAPGNASRQTLSGGVLNVLIAGVRSIVKALRCTVQWTTPLMMLLLAAAFPAAWRSAGRSGHAFRMPLLPLLGFVLLLGAGFMSTYYTQGYAGAPRLMDIQYDVYVLGAFFNLFYLTGWLRNRLLPRCSIDAAPLLATLTRARGRIVTGFAIVLVLTAAAGYDTLTSANAALSLVSGEAQSFHEEMLARFDTLENAEEAVVALPPLDNKPDLLLLSDYFEDPSRWENQRVANYFHKESLYTVTED